ncbi:DDE-type integrase/transposase/recombinase [Loigolactobacillus binensis]|uniref:DDE-type integrase/transposase/recombinase n=1 Tax=Loigolactobacillus binensis TaxID=2559922 RepID=A0ABW3EB49_9LACO
MVNRWQVADTEITVLATDTIRIALKVIKGIKLPVLHCDQGSSYILGEYNTFLASNGITYSMSRTGTPIDTSLIEFL